MSKQWQVVKGKHLPPTHWAKRSQPQECQTPIRKREEGTVSPNVPMQRATKGNSW